jgi:hypothetical protein
VGPPALEDGEEEEKEEDDPLLPLPPGDAKASGSGRAGSPSSAAVLAGLRL